MKIKSIVSGALIALFFLVMYFAPYIPPEVGDVSSAQQITNAQAVKVIVPYFTQCTKQTISPTTPTEITGNTSILSTTFGATAVQIFNLDTAATLFCSHDSAVAASGSHQGVSIAPAASAPFNWLSWGISTMQGWYCLSSSGSVSAMVCLTK